MRQLLCVGTYTEPILFGTGQIFEGKGKGIYLCALEDGRISVLQQLDLRNPSYLCIDEERAKIYAVNELKEFEGELGGGLTEIDVSGGVMKTVRSVGAGGADPCHVAAAPNGRFLSVANFASGSVSVFPLDRQGHLTGRRVIHEHRGCGAHPVRQKGPHAHSTVFVPNEDMMLVPDLGTDTVKAYRFDGDEIAPQSERDICLPPRSGPRYGEFSRDGKNFYLINEISSQVMHFGCSEGGMTLRGTVSTLPEGFDPDANICSDLHITPDGRYLYASNRGHDSICCYKILADGAPELINRVPCGGRTPRGFCVDPTGRMLLVGNQESDTIALFSIEEDGNIVLRETTDFPSPVCIVFFHGGAGL